MTAEVIELYPGLKRLPPDPDSRRERAKDHLTNAWCAVEDVLVNSPIVFARRSTLERREMAAFELGRASMGFLDR